MAYFPLFLSIVLVVRNESAHIAATLADAAAQLAPLVADYELIIVDNASTDDSLRVLKQLTQENGQPNLQVYALIKQVDSDTAAWVGLENALGDYVAVIDPLADDIAFLPQMLAQAARGADVVFADNTAKTRQTLAYRAAHATFSALYRWCNDIDLASEAPAYRVLSKRVVNFILQHDAQPALTYRQLPATGGFARCNLHYSTSRQPAGKPLLPSIDRGLHLLVATTRAPMRLVTALSLFGASANLLYSAYVVGVAVFKSDVAPGWVSLSLQQSGMFLLISLVLLVLGEYILQITSRSQNGPRYHVAQEFASARLTRCEKLNIEDMAEQDTAVRSLWA